MFPTSTIINQVSSIIIKIKKRKGPHQLVKALFIFRYELFNASELEVASFLNFPG